MSTLVRPSLSRGAALVRVFELQYQGCAGQACHQRAKASSSLTNHKCSYHTSNRLLSSESALSVPSVSSCPSPTCPCAATPPGLDIERRTELLGSAPKYMHHAVIGTGRSDWASRIEDEGPGGTKMRGPRGAAAAFRAWKDRRTKGSSALGSEGIEFNIAREMKHELGPRGSFFDPASTNLITNSSLPRSSLLLFPESLYFPKVESSEAGVSSVLSNHFSMAGTNENSPKVDAIPFPHPTILICSHATRDSRCGVLGPLLAAEFGTQLREAGYAVGPPNPDDIVGPESESRACVSMVSHIGGHKWAGNVIIYIPVDWAGRGQWEDPGEAAWRGVWYGRVEPKHVEGLIQLSLGKGKVVEELCRGIV